MILFSRGTFPGLIGHSRLNSLSLIVIILIPYVLTLSLGSPFTGPLSSWTWLETLFGVRPVGTLVVCDLSPVIHISDHFLLVNLFVFVVIFVCLFS